MNTEEFKRKLTAILKAEMPDNRKMLFRIGINLGDVIEEGERIYGDGINIAARLEGLADGGGVCISRIELLQIFAKQVLSDSLITPFESIV